MSQHNGTPESKPPRWTAEQKAAIESGAIHDPDTCGLDEPDGTIYCPRCILLQPEDRRRAAEAERRAREDGRLRPEAERLAEVIQARPDVLRPALLKILAGDVADIVLAVLDEGQS